MLKFTSPFAPIFPTPTAGNGRIRLNSARDGSGQGRGSSKRIGRCKQCGFLNDFRAIDTSGGDHSGDGARGVITKTDTTATTLNGSSIVEKYGDAAFRKGAGCAVCLSKNSASVPTHRSLVLGRSSRLRSIF